MEFNVSDYFEYKKEQYIKYRKHYRLSNPGVLIELGCGGRLTFLPTEYSIGIDISPILLEYFKNYYKNTSQILADAKYPPLRNNIADTIVINELLHHLISNNQELSDKNIYNCLRESKRVLKNNGSMYINELILSNKILRKLIYYITLLLSKKGINIPYLYINKGVIVNFMTENFFKKLLENLSLDSKLIYKKLWKIRYIKVGYLKQYIVTSKS